MTLRLKLFAIVTAAAIAVIALTVSSGLSDRAIETQVDSIRETYLPKIRLRPTLTAAFEHLSRTIQNAVEAADADLLGGAAGERDALLRSAAEARDAMTMGQLATLSFAVNAYFDAAIAVSRKLIAGDGGEAMAGQVQEMQGKRARVVELVEQITTFDERALASAFTATGVEQRRATMVRVVVGGIGLLAVLALSIWIARSVFASFRALSAGFERFGRNDFALPIATASDDELADVAAHANRMATELDRLDQHRARAEWLQRGLAGLGDQLRGELDPVEVADRTATYLARLVDAPVGALYYGPAGGPFVLLGRHAVASDTAARFALGEGLVGEAATRSTPTVIDGGDTGLSLRSGLVECAPRSVILAPIARGAAVSGVLELAGMRPWRQVDRDLLVQASETIAIALEVAHSRAATRELLERTQHQARELERVGATLEQKASELSRASAYKSQFLANMSHELRTPLNAIIGFSEILYDGSVPVDADTMHEYLGDILTSGKHLLQLINDVLDLAKVEAGKLEFHPEPIEVGRVIGEVLAVLRTTTAKQQIAVTTTVADDA
ncbi:MAG TPA: histidine kinase dimerization/phospho-acceptor domain-containing protein, partial [Kofleriaceae bacterium]